MKCPLCQSEMEKGILKDGVSWIKAEGIVSPFMSLGSAIGNLIVYAWKCPNCGKVELTTEE